jgi:hypothetical protein
LKINKKKIWNKIDWMIDRDKIYFKRILYGNKIKRKCLKSVWIIDEILNIIIEKILKIFFYSTYIIFFALYVKKEFEWWNNLIKDREWWEVNLDKGKRDGFGSFIDRERQVKKEIWEDFIWEGWFE